MNFAGAIQCADSPEKIQEKLKRIDSFLSGKAGSPTKLDNNNDSELLPQLSTPVEEDFVEVTYRALSAALLADRPVDFSNEKMLQRGVKLLNGQTVFKDHETSVDNWVGRVVETTWDTTTKGIPPGINAKLKLDAVKDPMAVRGVLQGALHSASVTVSFEWKPSHPQLMEDGTFFQHLGEEIDGELVRILVSKIEKFWEISLVWQGADEFAKQIGEDGKPVQQVVIPEDTEELTTSFAAQNQTVNTKEEEMNLLEILKKALGKDVTEETLEVSLNEYASAQVKTAQDVANQELSKVSEQLAASTKQVEDLKKAQAEEKTALESKIKELEPNARLGAQYLEDERKDAIRLCKLAKGDKVSEAILKTLEKSDLEVVQAWKQEFQKEVDEKFPSKCQKCSSTEISRQSAKKIEETEEKVQKVISSSIASTLNDLHS